MRAIITCLLGLCLLSPLAGCGGRQKGPAAEINVEEVRKDYDNWVEKRVGQIEADTNLSDEEKQERIEEVRAAAKGQMNEVQNLADGQPDQREQGR